MRVLVRAAVLAIATAAVLPTVAAAEPLPYTSITPSDGAVRLTTGGPMQITVQSPRSGMLLWAEVSTSSLPGVDGTLANDFVTEFSITLAESDAFPGTYRGTSYNLPDGYWWTSTPGTYYWQIHGAGGTISGWLGPVRKLTINAPPAPPTPPPTSKPQPPQTPTTPKTPAPDLDLTMTDGQVRGYVRTMIKERTNGRARSAWRECRRLSTRSMRCKLNWLIGRDEFSGTARFWHYLDNGEAYWNYSFAGKRTNHSCKKRTPKSKRCTRSLRWS